jgi:putative hydrolase of the HAD superfamily
LNLQGYHNIIFDLGGVVLDIDYNLTISAFKALGIENAATFYSKAQQIPLFDELEKGNITEEKFYDEMRRMSGLPLSDLQIQNAWNALLIGLPEENVVLLKQLKNRSRIFLLSNTNCIHERGYREMIARHYGSFILEDLFEKSYLSHHLHMRKPDPMIFEFVLADAGLDRAETLFIDDSPQHVDAARKLGINAIHLTGKLVNV